MKQYEHRYGDDESKMEKRILFDFFIEFEKIQNEKVIDNKILEMLLLHWSI